MVVDLYLTYQFLSRLVTPFNKWKAYETGVIDQDGNILVKKDDRSSTQKDSFEKFDLLVLKIKKMLEKIPGGSTRIGSWAAALWLIKEQNNLSENITDEEIVSNINRYMVVAEKYASINDKFELFESTSVAGSSAGGPETDLISHSLSMGKRKKVGKRKIENAKV